MKQKKSQAALEFLTTYAWAILAAILVIAIIAYFGIFKFGFFVPERCEIETGITCQDFLIGQYASGSGVLRLKIKNSLGDDIIISSWETSSEGAVPFSCSVLPVPTSVPNGESAQFDLDNCNNNVSGAIAGRKTKVNVKIGYHKTDSGLDRNTQGTVLETVELIGAIGSLNQSECSDTIDNDGNLCADFAGGDTGCSSPSDVSESAGACPSQGGAGMPLYCYTSTVCDGAAIFKVSGLTNAHSEIPTLANYNYNVCCRSANDTISNSCAAPDYIPLHLSNVSNAHAEKNTEANYGTNVCISAATGAVACSYKAVPCLATEACLATMSGDGNAHIGDCITAPYTARVCCTWS